MAAPRSTPTTRMRELAERLRELRLAKDLTVDSVAQSLLVSPSKISRLETAQRRASPRDVRDLCLLYGVSNDERDRLMALASQALETSWYQEFDLDAVYGTYIGLEEAASELLSVQNLVLPGLMQTPAYSRALLEGLRPPGRLSAERIHEMIEVRVLRQKLLHRQPPLHVRAIVDENALSRPIGGPEAMRGQLERLIELAEMDNVVLQIVPVSVGSHPGIDGRFTVLRFTDQVVRDTVYIEGLLGELFLDKDTDVARYVEVFDHIASDVALDVEGTRKRLEELLHLWKTSI